VPRELRTIVNVIARLSGRGDGLVLAGSHRDAWVRGAHDSGSGCVALLLAAEILAERARAGWTPEHGIALCFWDAEESGLIGSTEFGEAHAEALRASALAYVNSDASVSGTRLGVSGSPGLLGVTRAALEGQAPAASDRAAGHAHLGQQLAEGADDEGVSLGLPGSGSDFAVFLHHLGIPVVELGFHGNSGGQYHTRFDDFEVMDRWLDPGWEGHALAGRANAALLARMADTPGAGFDAAEAGEALGRHARALAQELGTEVAGRLAAALDGLAERLRAARGEVPAAAENGFYRALELRGGLAGRPWYRNRLWTAGLETGYSSETFPSLRAVAALNPDALERELGSLIEALRGFPRRESAPAAAR
jgi:N-acetylated-alpha-linked acidic dipeptidase